MRLGGGLFEIAFYWRSETVRPSAAGQNPRSGHRVALATRLRAVCDDEIVPPAVLQNLRRLRLATVLPNRNGCDSKLARLKTHAIGFGSHARDERGWPKFAFWVSNGAAHPAWGGLYVIMKSCLQSPDT